MPVPTLAHAGAVDKRAASCKDACALAMLLGWPGAARQSEAHAQDTEGRPRPRPRLPDDLVNLHWDPVTCAVALGWAGASVEELCLQAVLGDGVLRFQPNQAGRPTRVVVDLDGVPFTETWLAAVEAAQA